MEQRTKPVGIKDVAAAAGVSIATVSLVYNQKGQVAPNTRLQVQEIGRRLGYQPSILGRALQSGRSQIIGIVVSHVDSPVWQQTYLPYYRDIIAGAAIEAVEHGYAISVIPASKNGLLETGIPFSGVIIVDPISGDPTLQYCRDQGLAVLTDGPVPGLRVPERPPAVQINVPQSTVDMLDHLLAIHVRHQDRKRSSSQFRPALLTGPRETSYRIETEQSFLDWCRSRRIYGEIKCVGTDEDPLAAARELLARTPELNAVHCLNETYCAATLAAAEEVGLSIPTLLQVSVRGYGTAPLTEKRVAYLSIDTANTGALCARSLIDVVNGKSVGDQEIPYDIKPALQWEL